LRSAGITVIRDALVGSILEAKTVEIGGVFDPVSGKADESKAFAMRAAVGQELKEKFHADAWLQPSIVVVAASLSHDEARWDGASEGAGKGGFWKKFLATHSGAVPAMSIAVWLTDSTGRALYANAGCIQVVATVNLRGELAPVP
jgi:hypothetical protein